MPTISNQYPSGVKTGTLDRISCVLYDADSLDVSTLNMTLVSSTGTVLTAISSGVVQTGFSGVIIELDDPGPGPRTVQVILNSWPDLDNGMLYTFNVDIDDVLGNPL